MSSRYWDPRPEAERIAREVQTDFNGVWSERNWLNVPGPLYGAETDTCLCGVPAAPRNVLYDDNGMEFVWRQPASPDEVAAVLDAAFQDPFGGYNWDGHDHWTPELVMQWWDERERIETWSATASFDWLHTPRERRLAVDAVASFREYLRGPLGEDLRLYADWLATTAAQRRA
jgi:hypothetical protein